MLLLYTLRAHIDWHDKLALRKAYNTATINEDLLAKIAHELNSSEVQANLKQVYNPAIVDNTKLKFFPPFFLTTILHFVMLSNRDL